MQRSALLLGFPIFLLACGDGAGPTEVSGEYTIAITNESDSCDSPNFTVGETATGIPLLITQEGANITGTVGGAAAGYLDATLDGHVFTGSVDRYAFEMSLYGERAATVGNCTFTVNATMDGGIDGDTISGDIIYRPADNGGTDCGAASSCSTVQRFNGTRPPAQ